MRVKTGTIVSNKMMKTLVVKVDTYKKNTKYHKLYKDSKKYYVHVEDEKMFQEGQEVSIRETNPISKLKRWLILDNTQA